MITFWLFVMYVWCDYTLPRVHTARMCSRTHMIYQITAATTSQLYFDALDTSSDIIELAASRPN